MFGRIDDMLQTIDCGAIFASKCSKAGVLDAASHVLVHVVVSNVKQYVRCSRFSKTSSESRTPFVSRSKHGRVGLERCLTKNGPAAAVSSSRGVCHRKYVLSDTIAARWQSSGALANVRVRRSHL